MEEREKQILFNALEQIDFASWLDMKKIEINIDSFKAIPVKKGTEILKAGKLGKSFVIIGSGCVSVWQTDESGKEVKTCELGPGEYFGEISLLLGLPRIASFRAEENTYIFYMKESKFNNLFSNVPEIKDHLIKKANRRLKHGYAPSPTSEPIEAGRDTAEVVQKLAEIADELLDDTQKPVEVAEETVVADKKYAEIEEKIPETAEKDSSSIVETEVGAVKKEESVEEQAFEVHAEPMEIKVEPSMVQGELPEGEVKQALPTEITAITEEGETKSTEPAELISDTGVSHDETCVAAPSIITSELSVEEQKEISFEKDSRDIPLKTRFLEEEEEKQEVSQEESGKASEPSLVPQDEKIIEEHPVCEKEAVIFPMVVPEEVEKILPEKDREGLALSLVFEAREEQEVQRAVFEEAFLLMRDGKLLPEDDIDLYKELFKPVFAKKEVRLISGGQKDENFCIIARGKVIFKEGDVVKLVLGPGKHFGEIPLLYDKPRTADCFAEEDTYLFRLSRDNFFKYFVVDQESETRVKSTSLDIVPDVDLSVSHFTGQEWIKNSAIPILDTEEKKFRNILSRLSFYKYMLDSEKGILKDLFFRIDLAKNTVIFEKGMISSYFFIVAEGKIQAKKKDEMGQEVILDEFTRGAFFAEDSLIYHGGVYGDIVAQDNSKLYVISKKNFFRYIVTNPDIEAIVTLSAQDKITKTKQIDKPVTTQKVEAIPLTEEDYPLMEETIKKMPFAQFYFDRNYNLFRKALKKLYVPKDTKILGKGKKGNALIIIAKGKVSVKTIDESGVLSEQAELSQSDFFGEESLLLDSPRTVDFWAKEDTMLFYLSRKNFFKYFVIHADIEQKLKQIGEARLCKGYYQEKEEELAEVWVKQNSLPISSKFFSLFDDILNKFEYSKYLKREEMIALRNFFYIYPAHKGGQIIKHGTKGQYFFLVARGKVGLKKFTTTGEEVVVEEFLPGDHFGEFSLLRNAPREANYVALQNSILFCMRKADFLEILLSNQMVKQFISKRSEEKRVLVAKKRVDKKKTSIITGEEKREKLFLPEDLEGAMNAIRNLRFFRFLNRSYLETLIPQFVAVKFLPGSRVPMQDEKAFYILTSGRIAVMGRDKRGNEYRIHHLMPGDWFGENEILDAEPKKRDYYSDGTSVAFSLNEENFLKWLQSDFGARYYVEKSARLKNKVFEIRFPIRRPKTEQFSLSGGFVRNFIVLLNILKQSFIDGVYKPFVVLLKFIWKLFTNLSSFSLIALILFSEFYGYFYNAFHTTKRNLLVFLDNSKRNLEFILTTNLRNVHEQVKNLKEKTSPPEKWRCSAQNLCIYSRQMGIMLEVGVGIKRTFTILLAQITDKNLGKALAIMEKEVILKGLPVSVSMKRFPRIFSDFYVSLIRAGEVSGKLGAAFLTCADYQEKELNLMKKVSAAMVYPIVILICLICLMLGIVIFIMPTFISLFDELNLTLPVTTKLIIFLVKSVRNPWIDLMVIIFLVFLINSFNSYYKTVEGKRVIDTILINMVLFGNLIRKVTLTRFCWTLSGLINGGISILESLKTSETIISNMYMREQIQRCRLQIIEGKSLTKAFKGVDLLPPMFKDMVMVGEETGHLAEQLRKIGNFYDQEINYSIEAFSSLIEPILIMVMGVCIGFVLISLFLPIYQIVQSF